MFERTFLASLLALMSSPLARPEGATVPKSCDGIHSNDATHAVCVLNRNAAPIKPRIVWLEDRQKELIATLFHKTVFGSWIDKQLVDELALVTQEIEWEREALIPKPLMACGVNEAACGCAYGGN